MISAETRRAVSRSHALQRLQASNAAPLIDHPAMTRLERVDEHVRTMFMAGRQFITWSDVPDEQMARYRAEAALAQRKLDELCDWCREGSGQ